MRQLRRHIDASVAKRRHGTLFVQRLWSLSQNERTKSTSYKTKETSRKFVGLQYLLFDTKLSIVYHSLVAN